MSIPKLKVENPNVTLGLIFKKIKSSVYEVNFKTKYIVISRYTNEIKVFRFGNEYYYWYTRDRPMEDITISEILLRTCYQKQIMKGQYENIDERIITFLNERIKNEVG